MKKYLSEISSGYLYCIYAFVLTGLVCLTAGALPLGGDSISYFLIADAAPEWPDVELKYHHAQRFALPYLLGTLSAYCSLSPRILFQLTTFVLLWSALTLFGRIANREGLNRNGVLLLMTLFGLNPYVFRYYLSRPFMSNDVLFIAGMLLCIWALQKRSMGILLLGVAAAAFARQTSILMLPSLIWGVVHTKEWSTRKKIAAVLGVALLTITTYFWTGEIVATISSRSINSEHLLGLFEWLARGEDLKLGALFLIRFGLLLWGPLMVFAPRLFSKGIGRIKHFYLFLAACIMSQPILAGPEFSSADIQRLAGLGLGPFLLAFSELIPKRLPPRAYLLCFTLLFVGSMHHLYSLYGYHPDLRFQFSLFHLVSGISVGLCVWLTGEN